jgi:hypothetical protein
MTEDQITEHQNKVSRHRETVRHFPLLNESRGEELISSGLDHLLPLGIGRLDSQILKM